MIPDPPELPYFKTAAGLRVELWTRSPAYDLLSQCSLCFTTVGANTAELAALAVPMIVLLPTQQLDAMRSWDGLPGLLANLPVFGSSFAKAINWIIMQQVMRKGHLYAWPNIWAKTQVVPELVGKLQATEVAELALDYLNHPEKLQEMRDRLRSIRGEAGAAQKLAKLVCEELEIQNA
jgi:lipid-A-disaccharide synthase